jgi:hypothetical protein
MKPRCRIIREGDLTGWRTCSGPTPMREMLSSIIDGNHAKVTEGYCDFLHAIAGMLPALDYNLVILN